MPMVTAVSVRVWSEPDHVCIGDNSGLTFRYAQVEAGIASIHKVPGKALKATFRSRLKHFQRIGLVPSAPGKGQKIEYTVGDAIVWALCFEFAELGLPPEQIKSLQTLCGTLLYDSFQGPVQDEDQIFVLQGNFLEWHLNPEWKGVGPWGEGQTACGTVPLSKIGGALSRVPRALMINMTHLKRELGKALEVEWT
jgi:hypothetical protein